MGSPSNQDWSGDFSPPPTSSSSNSPWKYDVFLSFRGKDTRRSFTDHLYTALVAANISTFRDDKGLRKGTRISSELLKAIAESRISIVVLSRNYAASRWCLDELVKIIECKETMKQRVIPVFYDIDPTHVRNQTGSFADAFSSHVKRFVAESEMVRKWRVALTEIANLAGWDVQHVANGYESKSIQKIIREVLHETNQKYFSGPKYPVGLDSHVKKLQHLLDIGSDDVRILGITGLQGLGKTTIAKALYNSVCHLFEVSCFLEDVSSENGLVHLQENLDFESLGTMDLKTQDVLGNCFLNRRLCSKRVLIILDDVWEVDNLASIVQWLGFGSKIVIISRSRQLLLDARANHIYALSVLNSEEGMRLLSWHAFQRPSPPKDYWEPLKMLTDFTFGSALLLELFGSSLFGRTETEWTSVCREMHVLRRDKSVEDRHMHVLRICFDALPDEKIKDMFINIACFLKGTESAYVVDILNGCGFSAETGLQVLIDRCFLTIREDKTLWMHDMVGDFAIMIVRETSHTQKFNKFWFQGDGYDVPRRNYKGLKRIEGIFVDQQQIVHKAYARTSSSMVIPIDMVHPNRSFDGLRQVSWHQYPLDSLPAEDNLEKLVRLQMHYSNITNLWQSDKVVPNLKLLDLSHSKFLTTTPDFSKVPRIEKLSLRFCQGLMKVHQSIGLLGKLTDLNFEGCSNLRTLPECICKVQSLKYLTLSGCSNLERLPEQLGNLESLWVLDASETAIERLPDSIGSLQELLQLKLRSCENLRSLPNSICNLKSLMHLSLSYCSNLLSLPTNLGHIESLMELDVDGTAIRRLPHSIGLLKNLTKLSLQLCNGSFETNKSWFPFQKPLRYLIQKSFLPLSICGLSSLTYLNLGNCELSETDLPINLDKLYSLQHLDLRKNRFCSLPLCVGKLTNLKELQLGGCKSLVSIRELPLKLQCLNASDCTSLEILPDISNLKHLEYLNLENCCSLVEIRGLENLQNLHFAPDICLTGCTNLATISHSILHQGNTRFTLITEAPGELSCIITKTGQDRFSDRMQPKRGHDTTLLETVFHSSSKRKR